MERTVKNTTASILVPLAILAAVGLSILGNAPQRLPSRPKSDLAKAACKGDFEAVQNMVAKGADVNGKDQGEYGWTPLHYAAAMGDEAVAAFLIEKGADVNGRDGKGNTPLHAAGMMFQGEKTVGLLLKKGALVNAVNNEGKTALQRYITDSSYIESPAVDRLLEAGADPAIVDKSGHSPYLDSKKWNPEVQRKLERYMKKKK